MFLQRNLTISRGTNNSEASTSCVAQHFYTTTDTLSSVTTLGYFPPNFGNGLDNELIEENDLLLVYSSGDNNYQLYNLTNIINQPILGTKVTIQPYVNPLVPIGTGGSFPFNGPFGPTNITISAVKLGRQVTLSISEISGVSTSATTFTSAIPVIPAAYFPTITAHQVVSIQDGSNPYTGLFTLDTTGNVIIQSYRLNTGNFDSAGTAGIYSQFINYYTT